MVQTYLRAGEGVHLDVIHQYENQIELKLYYLLSLYLRLDHSWSHRARWVDGLEAFVWARTATTLQGGGELWWGHVAHIAGALMKEPVKVILGTRKNKQLIYLVKFGEGANRRCYANRGLGMNYRSSR